MTQHTRVPPQKYLFAAVSPKTCSTKVSTQNVSNVPVAQWRLKYPRYSVGGYILECAGLFSLLHFDRVRFVCVHVLSLNFRDEVIESSKKCCRVFLGARGVGWKTSQNLA